MDKTLFRLDYLDYLDGLWIKPYLDYLDICNFDYDCSDENNTLKNFYYGHDYHIIQLLLVLIRTSY